MFLTRFCSVAGRVTLLTEAAAIKEDRFHEGCAGLQRDWQETRFPSRTLSIAVHPGALCSPGERDIHTIRPPSSSAPWSSSGAQLPIGQVRTVNLLSVTTPPNSLEVCGAHTTLYPGSGSFCPHAPLNSVLSEPASTFSTTYATTVLLSDPGSVFTPQTRRWSSLQSSHHH